ncbi:MAG: OmpH family outer membrane protein [Sphingobium sp.]|nr:OmpH family outer membrane protein [Sphingobium sp.]
MKTLLKAAALATVPVMALAATAVPASAQSKLGIAVADLDQAVNRSTAATNARTQMQTTYKANIDNFNTRKTALDTELKQKAEALQAAVKAAAGKSTPALQSQYEALQKRQQEAQQELQTIGQPIALANAYVEEQIGAKINDALKAAMTKGKVDLVLQPGAAVSYQPSVDITAAVTAELNTLVPSVQIVPPAGWQPGGQQAAPAGQATGR